MKIKTNVLITSAGKRVSLVEAFKKELAISFPSSKVYTADMNPEWAPACRVSSQFFKLPAVTAESYIQELLSLCLTLRIGLVIPTIDTELQILALHSELFLSEGIHLVISDSVFIERCRDKRKTNDLFYDLKIKTPRSINPHVPTFPMFIKPYNGSLSQGIKVIFDADNWNPKLVEDNTLMFMEYLDPKEYQEYTIDAYFDRCGNLKCLVPRRRIEIRCGEISKGITEKELFYETLVNLLSKIEGARGCLTIQFFKGIQSNQIYGIEINPRFGGGYPLSYHAGANYPGMLINEYLKQNEIEFVHNWNDGIVMLRYDQELIFNKDAFIA